MSLVEDRFPIASEGCDYYHAAEGAQLRALNPNAKIQAANEGLTNGHHFNGTFRSREDRLEIPLRTRKPTARSIWNDSLPDAVPEPLVDQAIEVISACPQHIFLACTRHSQNLEQKSYGHHPDAECRALGGGDYLPNLCLGITAENQKWFDQHWKHLRQIPTSIIFVSHEPALRSITCSPDFLARGQAAWVITGGETGSRAWPMHPNWPRHDRDQCRQAYVPF